MLRRVSCPESPISRNGALIESWRRDRRDGLVPRKSLLRIAVWIGSVLPDCGFSRSRPCREHGAWRAFFHRSFESLAFRTSSLNIVGQCERPLEHGLYRTGRHSLARNASHDSGSPAQAGIAAELGMYFSAPASPRRHAFGLRPHPASTGRRRDHASMSGDTALRALPVPQGRYRPRSGMSAGLCLQYLVRRP